MSTAENETILKGFILGEGGGGHDCLFIFYSTHSIPIYTLRELMYLAEFQRGTGKISILSKIIDVTDTLRLDWRF